MMLRRKTTADGAPERLFLTGCVVSAEFLAGARPFYDPDLVDARFARRVADWCFSYHTRYGKAPGPAIQQIFEREAEALEETERELISGLLASLSDQYEQTERFDVPFALDAAEKLFKARALARLGREVNSRVAQGAVEEAEQTVATYKPVGRPPAAGANPFRAADKVMQAFESTERGLFTVPGALGRKWNGELHRDHFMALMGPEKRGKTWWLNELAIRAAKARCNVALFQIGDMTEEQVTLRLCVRLCGRSNLEGCCEEQAEPVPDCLRGQRGECRSKSICPFGDDHEPEDSFGLWEGRTRRDHEPCTECAEEHFFQGSVWYRKRPPVKPLTWREAWRVGKRFLGRTQGRDFRLSVHRADVLNVTDLRAILDNWERAEGFVPAVVVIDYADNLAPEDRREEYRHQQNRTWKALRGLSQERHCLVITATQASARAYDAGTMTMRHFSEDKRKFAHVTSMWGLNQTEEEKKAGLMRINPIVQREEAFSTSACVTVAQALWAGRPLLFSF